MSLILILDRDVQRATRLRAALLRQGATARVGKDAREVVMLSRGEDVSAIVVNMTEPCSPDVCEALERLAGDGTKILSMGTVLSVSTRLADAIHVVDGHQLPSHLAAEVLRAIGGVERKGSRVARLITRTPPFPMLTIAASTGGPGLVAALLRRMELTPDYCYTIVVHGPTWMLESYSAKLDAALSLPVLVARDGQPAQAGHIYVAPGEHHLTVELSPTPTFRLLSTPKVNYVRPAADVLFKSIAETFGGYTVAVVVTGLGRDGAAGAQAIASQGGRVIVQSPDTCIAPSMPLATLKAVPSAISEAPPKLPRTMATQMAALMRRLSHRRWAS